MCGGFFVGAWYTYPMEEPKVYLLDSVSLQPIENGYKVDVCLKSKSLDDYDYDTKVYAYTNLNDAIEKFKQIEQQYLPKTS